jgi:hypothetical protein
VWKFVCVKNYVVFGDIDCDLVHLTFCDLTGGLHRLGEPAAFVFAPEDTDCILRSENLKSPTF